MNLLPVELTRRHRVVSAVRLTLDARGICSRLFALSGTNRQTSWRRIRGSDGARESATFYKFRGRMEGVRVIHTR